MTQLTCIVPLVVIGALGAWVPQGGGWPPPGQGWPGPSQGGTNTGQFRPDPKFTDADGDPVNLEIGSGDKLGKAIAEIERFDPIAAGHIKAAHANGALGFYAIEGGQGQYGIARSTSILLVMEGRTVVEVAGSLYHEWQHERRLHGADDGVPNPPAVEDGPCSHVYAQHRHLELLASIQEYWQSVTGDLVVSCKELRRCYDLCNKYYDDCVDSGGSPEANCAVPILQNCP